MNQDQAFGLVRWAAALVLGWATGKGYITTDTATQIAAAAVAVAGAVWSWFSNRPKPTA